MFMEGCMKVSGKMTCAMEEVTNDTRIKILTWVYFATESPTAME